jgi:hypothetical protein
MKTIGRTGFMAAANIAWLALFVAEVLAVLAPDYLAWWRPTFMQSCHEDSYRYDITDRAFVFGLVWMLTAPLMTMIAMRVPGRWPAWLTRIWWKKDDPALSLLTAAAALVLMLWPLTGMLFAPVQSKFLLEAMRAVVLASVLVYYRAVILSA